MTFYDPRELDASPAAPRLEPVGLQWSHRDAIIRPEQSATLDNAESEHSHLHVDVSLDHLLDEQTLDEGEQIKARKKGVPNKGGLRY